jgi:DNA-binding transcriptional LysR family regulator
MPVIAPADGSAGTVASAAVAEPDPQRSALAGVDLNLLVALDALLTERSVTRAGQRLSITQSAMSGALGRLRGLFGDELLVRSGQAMRLTTFAESLQAPLREALVQLEATVFSRSAFDPQREQRTFTISATDYTSLVFLSRLPRELAAKRTHVRMRVTTNDVHGSIRRLEAGEIDLAILPANFGKLPPLSAQRLFDEEFVPVCWRGNEAIREPLTFEALATIPLLSYRLGPLPTMVERRFEELGVHIEPAVTLDGFVDGAFYLRGTEYVTFLQRRLVERLADAAELRVLATSIELPRFVETMWWHPKASKDAAHEWFRDQLLAVAAELARSSPAPMT